MMLKNYSEENVLMAGVLEQAKALPGVEQQAQFQLFISRFYDTAFYEDLKSRSAEELTAIASYYWRALSVKATNEAVVRVFNPRLEQDGWTSRHSVVQVLHKDMPFLFDSITANLVELGHGIRLSIHPVIQPEEFIGVAEGEVSEDTDSNALSMIFIELDAQLGEEQLLQLQVDLGEVLAHVRAVVDDWKPMVESVTTRAQQLADAGEDSASDELAQAADFLDWLIKDNFTFIGYQEWSSSEADGQLAEHAQVALGIARESIAGECLTDFNPADNGNHRVVNAGERPILVSKSAFKSRVHRLEHCDTVTFALRDDQGREITGRLYGLFTSASCRRRPNDIPLLNSKFAQVIKRTGFSANGHDGKKLLDILESLPRSELYQCDVSTLFDTAMGIFGLYERPQTRVFIRRDDREGYASVLVYVPRDQFSSELRHTIEGLLVDAFQAKVVSRQSQLSNDLLARWHIVIHPRQDYFPTVDTDAVCARIEQAIRHWKDQLQGMLEEKHGEERGRQLFRIYGQNFSSAYQEHFTPQEAALDIEHLESLRSDQDIRFNLYRDPDQDDRTLNLKIYTNNNVVALSDCLPVLENLGFRVIDEFGYDVITSEQDAQINDVYTYTLEHGEQLICDLAAYKSGLETMLHFVWQGQVENDGFNRLVLHAGLTVPQVVVLRAYGKYMRQLGVAYSEEYMQQTLVLYPEITQQLVNFFATKFDCDLPGACMEPRSLEANREAIIAALGDVGSLDHDRILRGYFDVIDATQRTNFYQLNAEGAPKTYCAFKIESARLEEAPKPRPHAEIFVYSPDLEGVHLRGGTVARGGLRWSDRPEDFRTEILGLVKAQQVKNAVIVPVGAKGGFVPKKLGQFSSRDAVMKEVVRCYRTFISALLDVTDNLAGGVIVPPARVIRYDGDDNYLVVAADKGTATFSDIANEISVNYDFWLNDAFASGGSNGYDHKQMGITAKGAWVSVQQHFRELGIDVQQDAIRVAGVGDMSGDVFGNGMLCSEAIQLCAAFDHRDIFLDPQPDAARSYRERERLFKLPKSSWQDYDTSLISQGGGVFSRSAKAITLTPEIRSLLNIADSVTEITPNDLIRAILCMEADLLWFGGIGTYIKASSESHIEVGDPFNDAIRVNAAEVRCRAIGEGANLGITQPARIEYARNGGRLNTDAIDNSAGVNCSDLEVNIKILLNSVVAEGRITLEQRNQLLEEMTDEVAELVLRNNFLQNQAIGIDLPSSERALGTFARLTRHLEQNKGLDRKLEYLPDEEELNERMSKGQGMVRPELAVLLSYSKMSLYDELLASRLIDDPYFDRYLNGYFPRQLVEQFPDAVLSHPLRREIIATAVANEIFNRGGIHAIREQTGASIAEIVRAFYLTKEVFALDELWLQVEGLDTAVPTALQIRMLTKLQNFFRLASIWFVNHVDYHAPLGDLVDRFRPQLEQLDNSGVLGAEQVSAKTSAVITELVAAGIDEGLARRVMGLEKLTIACDIIKISEQLAIDSNLIAPAYFQIGERMGFDWLSEQLDKIDNKDHWARMAWFSVTMDLLDTRRNLTRKIISEYGSVMDAAEFNRWLADGDPALNRVRNLVDEFQGVGQIDMNKVCFVAHQMRSLV